MIKRLTAKRLMSVFPEVFTKDKAGRFHAREVHKEAIRIWHHSDIRDLLQVLDGMLSGYGVEYIDHPRKRTALAYINMGDTYIDTVMFDFFVNKFYIGSWGDWVEWREKVYGRFD